VTAVVVAEAVAIAILSLLISGLLRTQTRIVEALRQLQAAREATPATRHGWDGVPTLAAVAPEVSGVDLDGRPVRLATDRRRVLAFLTSGCSSCGWWWQQLAAAGSAMVTGLVVVTPDPGSDAPDDIRALWRPGLAVVMSSGAWEAYGVRSGSTFVVVDDGRIVAAGSAGDWDALAALLSAAPA
jgi:hypothetical protein